MSPYVRLTEAQKRALPMVDVSADDLTFDGKSNPFNTGLRVLRYRPDELRTQERSRTKRTAFFEEKLVWLSEQLGGRVPAAFRLADGSIRSLDGGCLGFLYNKDVPEITLQKDREGYVIGVTPKAPLRRRHQTPHAPVKAHEFTMPDLCARGQAPTMAFLVAAIEAGEERVTYGQVAANMNSVLNLTNVNHHHVGSVVDAMMARLENIDSQVPLLNVMVVRADAHEPGEGADAYLKQRYSVARFSAAERAKLVRRALNEIKAFDDWADLYRRAYQTPLPAGRPLDEFDDDGQPDNPKLWKKLGAPESVEHKRLKAYVQAHPKALRLNLTDPIARIERPLPSGDRLDVEIVDGVRWIGVEVKSIRSGDEDLRRGIYQCVKYKAVMEAQSALSHAPARCEALLVVERPLPPHLLSDARRLGVRHLVLKVN